MKVTGGIKDLTLARQSALASVICAFFLGTREGVAMMPQRHGSGEELTLCQHSCMGAIIEP